MTRREGSQGARDPKSKSLLCPLACEFARRVGSRAHGTERHAWTLVAELASQGALARGSGPPSALSLPPPPLSLSPLFLSSQPYPSSARRLPAWDKGRRGDWPASEYYGHARVAQGAQVPRWVGTEPDKPPLPSATRGKRRAAAGAFGTARLRRLGGGRLDSFARPAPAPAGTRSLSSHPLVPHLCGPCC